tara:strand:+ start:693 stop:2102 length:1410 start_codon:yes stop_codon:yes gene_type:complete
MNKKIKIKIVILVIILLLIITGISIFFIIKYKKNKVTYKHKSINIIPKPNRNCSEVCDDSYDDESSVNINCKNPGNIQWINYEIEYTTNNRYKIPTNVSRKVNIYHNNKSNRVLLYLGGTYEIDPTTNNIFCNYKNTKYNKYNTDGGGYYHRNDCMIKMSSDYTIIQIPQITPDEVDILIKKMNDSSYKDRNVSITYKKHVENSLKKINNKCDNEDGHSDSSKFWFVYNNNTPTRNPDKNNLGERYNKDICGNNSNSPDKDFFNVFFNDNIIKKLLDNKDIFIGGYSGGAYMTGRLIFESINNRIPYKFKGAFILSGAPFHCISPWGLNDQYCPPSAIDKTEYIKTTINVSEKFIPKDIKLKSVPKKVDFYKNNDELKQFPPTIFLSPEYDDIVKKELVRYYYKLLNNVSPDKHKIVIPFINDNHHVKHNWFGRSTYTDDFKDIDTEYKADSKTNGMCYEINKFFNNIQ